MLLSVRVRAVAAAAVVYGVPITGTASAPVLGRNVTTESECRSLCEALPNCNMYAGSYGDGEHCTWGEWCWVCFGRTDDTWAPREVSGFVSARRVSVPRAPGPYACTP